MSIWSLRSTLALAVFSVVALGAPSLNAAYITGTLNIAGAVGVGATTIDFQLPIGPPNGEFTVTNTGNTGSFAPLAGTTGSILDLDVTAQPVGPTFNLPGFLTFNAPAGANIRFDLTRISPGIYSPAQCFDAPAAGQVCTPPAPGPGSANPFNLANTSATSSTASIQVSGNVVNTLTNEVSQFTGVFTTQFPDLAYQDLLAIVANGGTVNTSYSSSFIATVSAVPEPGALTLIGAGMTLLGLFRWRKQ